MTPAQENSDSNNSSKHKREKRDESRGPWDDTKNKEARVTSDVIQKRATGYSGYWREEAVGTAEKRKARSSADKREGWLGDGNRSRSRSRSHVSYHGIVAIHIWARLDHG